MNELLWALGFSVGVNLVMFLVAFLLKTDKLTDISYAVTFLLVVWGKWWWSGANLNDLVVVLLVSLWAMRLGGFLLFRIWKTGKDRRFDEIRGNFVKFFGFWFLQGISVFVILIPSILNKGGDNWWGLIIWGGGLALETVADWQKWRFNSIEKNRGRWIDEGVWSISRHPNYLGEMMVWIGIYLYVYTGLLGVDLWIGLASPLYIVGLLMFVSGVPILEKRADEKWGKLKEYMAYKKKVGVLLPKQLIPISLSVVLAQLAGFVGSIFTIVNIPTWYAALNKPSWNPPNFVFGPVWVTLYTLMGIAAYLVWEKREKKGVSGVLLVYLFHLGINSLWSIVFFGWKELLLAFGVIVVLWLLISYLVVNFWKYSKWAGYLMLPYLFWVSFASILNLTVWMLN